MYWTLHITVEYFRSSSHQESKNRVEIHAAHNNHTYLRRLSAAVLCFFSSKICTTLVALDRPPQPSASFSAQLEARINDKLRVISYNRAYIEYSHSRNCHSFFFISTSKLIVIMRTLDPPHFYCGRRRFRAFELLLSCDLNSFPVSPSAFFFCHICGRANSTWTYYSIYLLIPSAASELTYQCAAELPI